MSYIIPGYIKIQKNKDAILIENEYTGLIIKLELIYYTELNDMIINGHYEKDSKLFTFLYKHQIIIDEIEFPKYIELYSKNENDTLSIIIFATEQCNFRCKYCYENFKHKSMDKNQYSTIYKFINEKLKNASFKFLLLNWFGGEPLLESNNIIAFNQKIRKVAEQNKVDFISTITTNGYFLNPEIFNALYNSGSRKFQITIDGSFHNSLRPLINGDPTKETIIENIKKKTIWQI